jgi:hypothetical protein
LASALFFSFLNVVLRGLKHEMFRGSNAFDVWLENVM